MKLLVDSGSTKADWALIGPKTLKRVSTAGFNPYIHKSDDFIEQNGQRLHSFLASAQIDKVICFVAGADTKQKKAEIFSLIQQISKAKAIEINDDLELVRQALLGNKSGIISILGTGSFTAYNENGQIIRKIVSTGYICNDEGSGYDIGRIFLKHLFSNRFSERLKSRIRTEFLEDSLTEIKKKLYHSMDLKRTVSAYSRIVGQLKDEVEIIHIIRASFNSFVHFQLKQFDDLLLKEISIVGSVAYHFQDILKDVLQEAGYIVKQIQQKPLDLLIAKMIKDANE